MVVMGAEDGGRDNGNGGDRMDGADGRVMVMGVIVWMVEM